MGWSIGLAIGGDARSPDYFIRERDPAWAQIICGQAGCVLPLTAWFFLLHPFSLLHIAGLPFDCFWVLCRIGPLREQKY
jgi:hypothetical protein